MTQSIASKYAIVGVGESARSKNSGTTPLHLALDAARAAIADAGLDAKEIDGFMSYSEGDSCTAHQVATYLGAHPKYVKDISGGGSSTELLIADAVALIETGQANTILIYRAMNGRSGVRMGGGGWSTDMLQGALDGGSFIIPYGAGSPSQWFGLFAQRHMHVNGITKEHLGHVCLSAYEYAQKNPKAFFYGKPLTMEDYLATAPLSDPFNKHDFCLESDEANALIITSAKHAQTLQQKPAYILGVSARRTVKHAHYWQNIDEVAADYVAADLYEKTGVKPRDIQVASIYDCYSWVVIRQLEAYGLAPKGQVGDFVAAGNLRIDGQLPTNLAGGMLAEGYTHGMNNVLEIVRQVRGEYSGTARQAQNHDLGICTGWAGPDIAGAMLLHK